MLLLTSALWCMSEFSPIRLSNIQLLFALRCPLRVFTNKTLSFLFFFTRICLMAPIQDFLPTLNQLTFNISRVDAKTFFFTLDDGVDFELWDERPNEYTNDFCPSILQYEFLNLYLVEPNPTLGLPTYLAETRIRSNVVQAICLVFFVLFFFCFFFVFLSQGHSITKRSHWINPWNIKPKHKGF